MSIFKDTDISVIIKSVNETGSCNACSRGTLTEDGRISRPYKNVYEIQLHSLEVRLCKDCKKRLIEKLEQV